MVEDVALHDLGRVPESLVLGVAHLVNVEQQLTVGLHCIVEPADGEGRGGEGRGGEGREEGREGERRGSELLSY